MHWIQNSIVTSFNKTEDSGCLDGSSRLCWSLGLSRIAPTAYTLAEALHLQLGYPVVVVFSFFRNIPLLVSLGSTPKQDSDATTLSVDHVGKPPTIFLNLGHPLSVIVVLSQSPGHCISSVYLPTVNVEFPALEHVSKKEYKGELDLVFHKNSCLCETQFPFSQSIESIRQLFVPLKFCGALQEVWLGISNSGSGGGVGTGVVSRVPAVSVTLPSVSGVLFIAFVHLVSVLALGSTASISDKSKSVSYGTA
ncbi:hypothetical protein Tco_1197722 [Tanacetum coccineum]